MNGFSYTEAQWQSIVAAAGVNGRKLQRQEIEELAAALLENDRAINCIEQRQARRAAIAALERAEEPDLDQVDRRRWVEGRIAAIAPARKPKGSREHLLIHALSLWFAIGNGVPGRHRQSDGPAIRFVRAVFDPVFASAPGKRGGALLVTTIQAAIEKMLANRDFEKIGLLD